MIVPALRIFTVLTLLTGLAYPLLVTGIAQSLFAEGANGSLIRRNGTVIGSALIAQKFERPTHFFSRPSAIDYNPMPSGGSNLGPLSQDLKLKVEERRKASFEGDLLYASGSGLDPHVSPESAIAQIPRIVSALRPSPSDQEHLTREVSTLIDRNRENRQWGILGEPRVNVLKLNLELDEIVKRGD